MPDYSSHQKKIIKRYYDNREDIVLARLGDIVSEFYLVEGEKKIERLWRRAEQAMRALKVPDKTVDRIVSQGNPDVLARHVRTWLQPGGQPGGKK